MEIKSKSITTISKGSLYTEATLSAYQRAVFYRWLQHPLRSDEHIVWDQLITGPLHIAALNSALIRLINDSGGVNCNVLREAGLLHWVKRRALSEEEWLLNYYATPLAETEIQRLKTQAFDLEHDLLTRFYAIRLDDNRYRVIYILSPVLIDEIGFEQFTAALEQYYQEHYDAGFPGISAQVSRYGMLESEQPAMETDAITGNCPLSPWQSWFFHQLDEGIHLAPHHYNHAFMVDVPLLDKEILEGSIRQLLYYHDALRLCYEKREGAYQQYYQSFETVPLQVANVRKPAAAAALGNTLTNWQQRFNLTRGPLFTFGYIDGYSHGRARLFFACHRLIMDEASAGLVLSDLQQVYQHWLTGIREGRVLPGELNKIPAAAILGPKGESYRQWINAAGAYAAATGNISDERHYWAATPAHIAVGNALLQANATKRPREISFTLDKDRTALLLGSIHDVLHTGIRDLLLSALGITVSGFLGDGDHCVLLEDYVRETGWPDTDVSRTTGNFGRLYPVLLPTGNKTDIGAVIEAVKTSLQQIPANGMGYGILYGYTGQELPMIRFKYTGSREKLTGRGMSAWQVTSEAAGLPVAEKNRHYFILDIHGFIREGQLCFQLSGRLTATALTDLGSGYQHALEMLISYLGKSRQAPRKTFNPLR
ncbi:condensation domain-containing protein [Chitinophaga nivalis]|uniref:Condensation domain-containing protein n=1 Tax=Chitinophaga nivalis TaxID=2991709 RepID=A0ABT3IJ07_9BACT|nr:condensation domain-containing protein [Chitinophaga nivalis]MCW3466359.1 condensation domain-containing protein [Chitinophaga nivalis]MCW3483950.1 condensation domain-containing protein [Chitinophaga nivalis]